MQTNNASDAASVYPHKMLPEVPTGIKARSRYQMASQGVLTGQDFGQKRPQENPKLRDEVKGPFLLVLLTCLPRKKPIAATP